MELTFRMKVWKMEGSIKRSAFSLVIIIFFLSLLTFAHSWETAKSRMRLSYKILFKDKRRKICLQGFRRHFVYMNINCVECIKVKLNKNFHFAFFLDVSRMLKEKKITCVMVNVEEGMWLSKFICILTVELWLNFD